MLQWKESKHTWDAMNSFVQCSDAFHLMTGQWHQIDILVDSGQVGNEFFEALLCHGFRHLEVISHGMGCSTKHQALEWQQQLCLHAVTGLVKSILVPILPKGVVAK